MKKKPAKKQSVVVSVKKVERTTVGLRNALFDELDGLRSRKTDPAKANAISKNAAQILATARLEMDHQRFLTHMHKKGHKLESTTPLLLGS